MIAILLIYDVSLQEKLSSCMDLNELVVVVNFVK
jgi:hypothetical protein